MWTLTSLTLLRARADSGRGKNLEWRKPEVNGQEEEVRRRVKNRFIYFKGARSCMFLIEFRLGLCWGAGGGGVALHQGRAETQQACCMGWAEPFQMNRSQGVLGSHPLAAGGCVALAPAEPHWAVVQKG